MPGRGSVAASDSSCAITLREPSMPALPLGEELKGRGKGDEGVEGMR